MRGRGGGCCYHPSFLNCFKYNEKEAARRGNLMFKQIDSKLNNMQSHWAENLWFRKADVPPSKPTPSSRLRERQKSATLAWNVEKQVIGCNLQKPIIQTKMTTEGNSICFSGLKDLSTISSALTETLESKNYVYKSQQKHISVKSKLDKLQILAKHFRG